MSVEGSVTRRVLLEGAAGGAAALAAGGVLGSGVPAWARPVSQLTRLRRPDSLPFPKLPAGHESLPHIRKVVVLMMENHSFDNVLGMVPGVDGLTVRGGRVRNYNRDARGHRVYAHHPPSPCQEQGKPSQSWNASHVSYDRGRNDGFVRAGGAPAMWFWDHHTLPFTYSLAKHFPIGERYFSSVLSPTYPNRRFLFAGTASGVIATSPSTLGISAANGTIFDRLERYGIDYGVYSVNLPSWLILPEPKDWFTHQNRMVDFYDDAASGNLPPVSFIDPNYLTGSEENPQDIQVGEQFVASVVQALTNSPHWPHIVLLLTYDEHGGYYDHVPPPRAIKPDSIPPQTAPGDQPGAYDRYGFRVPLIVVSPWARRNYISRVVQDHASITAFIERKWNLPAMTFRDANAAPMTDYFDFTQPAFLKPPLLAGAPPLGPGLALCHAVGLNPPL